MRTIWVTVIPIINWWSLSDDKRGDLPGHIADLGPCATDISLVCRLPLFYLNCFANFKYIFVWSWKCIGMEKWEAIKLFCPGRHRSWGSPFFYVHCTVYSHCSSIIVLVFCVWIIFHRRLLMSSLLLEDGGKRKEEVIFWKDLIRHFGNPVLQL